MARNKNDLVLEPFSNRPTIITHSPNNLLLATESITISRRQHLELSALIRIRGRANILFRIFRDGEEIYRSSEWPESDLNSEADDLVPITFIDSNVEEGTHTYNVTAENITNGRDAAVVGPSNLHIGPLYMEGGSDFINGPGSDINFDFDVDFSNDQECGCDVTGDPGEDFDQEDASNRSRGRSRDDDCDEWDHDQYRDKDRGRDYNSGLNSEIARRIDRNIDRFIKTFDRI